MILFYLYKKARIVFNSLICNLMSLHLYLDGVLHNAAVVVVQLDILSEIALIDRFICRFLISQIYLVLWRKSCKTLAGVAKTRGSVVSAARWLITLTNYRGQLYTIIVLSFLRPSSIKAWLSWPGS